MMQHLEMQEFLDCILYVLDAGIAEFNNLIAVGADKMIMLPIAV